MILYFADRTMQILGMASTELPEGLTIADDLKSEDVDSGVAIFECTIPYNSDDRELVESCTAAGNYLLRSNDGENEFYTIIETEADTKNQTVYIYAEDAGMDLLNEVNGAYEATEAHPISYYVEYFANDTGFVIGINEIENLSRKLSWTGEATTAERLASVATQFDNAEISYSFDVQGLEITNKYINIYAQRGKDAGVQLRLNKDIDRIITKKSVADLATSLQPTGGIPDGEEDAITLKGYEYDDGDFYVTSSGRLNSREALKKWSRYVWEKEPNQQLGYTGHIVKQYSYDTTSQSELCNRAISELKDICDVAINYEVDINTLPDNVKIGDTVYIVDDDGELYLSARILEMTTSVCNQKQTATLGDYLIQDSGISQTVADLAAQFSVLASSRTYYTWIAYADDEEGNGISLDSTGKKYMGIASNRSSSTVDLSDPSVFTWSLIQGEDGSYITSNTITYQSNSSGTEAPEDEDGWSESVVEASQGEYLWTKVETTYSTGETSTSYSVSYIAIDGLDELSVKEIIANEGYITSLQVNDLLADYVTTENLSATFADVETLMADYVKTDELQATVATFGYLTADELEALIGNFGYLTAESATITLLNSEVANITSILSGNIGTGTLQSIHITSDNVVFDEAVINDAAIVSLTADKITSGTIYTDLVKIANNTGENMLIDGATIWMKDASGTYRTQFGLDASGEYNLYFWDADGNITFNTAGLTEEGLTGNGAIIRDAAIADDANINESKIDMQSVAERLNEDGSITVDYANIKVGDTTLDYALTTITNNADAAAKEAEAANAAAAEAQATANQAQADATQAASDAAAAQSTADAAAQAASDAQSVADTAKASAATAQTAADEAQSTADAAAEAAANAQTYAEQVQRDAASSLSEYAESISTTLDGLQAQVDGQIETWYYDYVPTLKNLPASDWATDDEKESHIGDLFFDKSTGYSYRFFNNNGTYEWVLIQDTDITTALATASTAQDTADAKKRVFTSTPTPPYDVGDLWTDGTDIKTCMTARASGATYVSSDWVVLNDYVNQDAVDAVQAAADAAQSAADSAQSAADTAAVDAATAQETANTAAANAATAQEAANTAQAAAQDAQAAADAAQADVNAVASRTTTLETELEVVQGYIKLIVSETDITELQNGDTTLYQLYSSLDLTVDGITGTVSELETKVGDNYEELTSSISELSLTLDEITLSVSTVESRIDNLTIGTRNYVLNSGGYTEDSDTSCIHSTSSTFDTYYTVTACDGYMHIECTSTTTTSRYAMLYISDAFDPEATYTLTARIRTGETSNISIYMYSSPSTKSIGSYTPTTVDEWEDIQITFTFDDSVGYAWESICFYLSNYRTAGDYIDIAWMKLEKGTVATDWTPAPEDVNNTVSSLTESYATLTLNVDAITSEVGTLQTTVDDNYTTLTRQISEIEQTASSISLSVSEAYAVLPENLISDGTFEGYTTFGSSYSWYRTTSDYIKVSEYNDKPCIYFTYGGSNYYIQQKITTTGTKFLIKLKVACGEGSTPLVSVGFQTSTTATSTTSLGTVHLCEAGDATTDWVTYTASMETKTAPSYVRIYVYSSSDTSSSAASTEAYITDIVIYDTTEVSTAVSASLVFSIEEDEDGNSYGALSANADYIYLKTGDLIIESDQLTLDAEGNATYGGKIEASALNITSSGYYQALATDTNIYTQEGEGVLYISTKHENASALISFYPNNLSLSSHATGDSTSKYADIYLVGGSDLTSCGVTISASDYVRVNCATTTLSCITKTGDIEPSVTDSYDIGTTDYRYDNIYANSIDITGIARIGGSVRLTNSSRILSVDSNGSYRTLAYLDSDTDYYYYGNGEVTNRVYIGTESYTEYLMLRAEIVRAYGEFYCYAYGTTTFRRPIQSATSDGTQVCYISSGSSRISVNGQFGSTSTFSTYTISATSSDIRLKENVMDSTTEAMPIIRQMQLRQFDWKLDSIHQDIGFIADELELLDSKLAIGGGENEEGQPVYKSIDTLYLLGYVVKALQELDERLTLAGI